jgi:hypothetical protein
LNLTDHWSFSKYPLHNNHGFVFQGWSLYIGCAVLNFRFLFNFSLNFTLRNLTLEEKFWCSFTGLARSSRDNGQGIEAGGMFDSSYFNYCFMLISTLFGVKFDYYEHNICRT